jgi:hypothetical protein
MTLPPARSRTEVCIIGVTVTSPDEVAMVSEGRLDWAKAVAVRAAAAINKPIEERRITDISVVLRPG